MIFQIFTLLSFLYLLFFTLNLLLSFSSSSLTAPQQLLIISGCDWLTDSLTHAFTHCLTDGVCICVFTERTWRNSNNNNANKIKIIHFRNITASDWFSSDTFHKINFINHNFLTVSWIVVMWIACMRNRIAQVRIWYRKNCWLYWPAC